MHNGNGHGYGNGKRLVLIGLLVLGGFWLVSDSYSDGYRDALIDTGQVTNARRYERGPHFPWGLVIVGGIAYLAWRKGAFDRFGGPGGPFESRDRGIQRYGGMTGPNPWLGPAFRGPRAYFDDWHRQAHEAMHPTPPAPPASTTPSAGPAMEPPAGNGAPQSATYAAPAPSAPSPEYWASMTREPGPGNGGNAGSPPPPAGTSV